MNNYLISICIPSYKRLNYLKRLLDSIAVQSFKNFEVVITDDSPDDSVHELVQLYKDKFSLQYYKNQPALGTPANWNSAISKATGEWIKLMHDDDWFATSESLQQFADNTTKGSKFIFSAFILEYEEKRPASKAIYFPGAKGKQLINEPLILMASNIIGQPSVTMVHKSINVLYDERLKWRVDIDFYIRVLAEEKSFTYIPAPIICISINEGQVTNDCFENPYVELPEGLLVIKKYGLKPFNNIIVYDAWWRLLRNMKINNPAKLTSYAPEKWPKVIITITKHLSTIPASLLKFGVASKIIMFFSYLLNTRKDEY